MALRPDKVQVECPNCQQALAVPADSLGKMARCPRCQTTFDLQEPEPLEEAAAAPDWSAPPAPAASLAAAPTPAHPFAEIPPASPFAPPQAAAAPPAAPAAPPAKYDGAFGLEKRGLDSGVVGGLIMMLIGGVWFVVGLMADRIFFYPPILFLLGLFGLLKGLFTGNVAGRK